MVPTVTLPKFAVAGVSAACGAVDVATALQLKAMDCCAIGDGKLALKLAVSVSTTTGKQLI